MTFLLAAWSFLKRVPWQVYAAGVLVVAFLWFRSHYIGVGVERCRGAQEAAERKADAKAAVVAKQAQERAGKATAKIRARTNEVADEVSRQMDGVRVCPDPVQPPSVRDAGEQAVERARRALSPD